MKVLLDTNVVSEIRNPQGSVLVKAYVAKLKTEESFLSVVSLGELAKGIALLPEGEKHRMLDFWLGMLEREFANRILNCDVSVARVWGQLTANAQLKGRVVAAADGLIAATAIHHGLRLVTRNVRHFQGIVPEVVDPWLP